MNRRSGRSSGAKSKKNELAEMGRWASEASMRIYIQEAMSKMLIGSTSVRPTSGSGADSSRAVSAVAAGGSKFIVDGGTGAPAAVAAQPPGPPGALE